MTDCWTYATPRELRRVETLDKLIAGHKAKAAALQAERRTIYCRCRKRMEAK